MEVKEEEADLILSGGDGYYDYGCLLEFYALATSMVISLGVQTYERVHSVKLNSAASLGNQTIGTMI